MVPALKSQDVFVGLRLSLLAKAKWTYVGLSQQLAMSSSEVHACVRRLTASHLYSPILNRINRAALHEFLVHGLRYAFPAVISEQVRGVSTGVTASGLSSKIFVGFNEQWVWMSDFGVELGRRVEPLYPSAPEAATRDPALHQLLALADVLRFGRARERQMAGSELRARLQ